MHCDGGDQHWAGGDVGGGEQHGVGGGVGDGEWHDRRGVQAGVEVQGRPEQLRGDV